MDVGSVTKDYQSDGGAFVAVKSTARFLANAAGVEPPLSDTPSSCRRIPLPAMSAPDDDAPAPSGATILRVRFWAETSRFAA